MDENNYKQKNVRKGHPRTFRQRLVLFLRQLRKKDSDIGCRIPPSCHLSHGGLGCVFSESTQIGENVIIHQHVTLGEMPGRPNVAPRIGDNVNIFPHCLIVGDVEIGANSIIGGLTFLQDVKIPPNSIVYSEKKLLIKKK